MVSGHPKKGTLIARTSRTADDVCGGDGRRQHRKSDEMAWLNDVEGRGRKGGCVCDCARDPAMLSSIYRCCPALSYLFSIKERLVGGLNLM